ncbi:MAG: hypothetical protein V5A46_04140 [Haloferacaceae archaeon]
MALSRRPSRRTVAVATLLAIAVAFGAGTLLEPATHDPPAVERVEQESLIRPAENGSYLWPYTSSGETASGRTLAINLIVHGPDDAVRRSLTDSGSLEFEREEPEAGGEAAGAVGAAEGPGGPAVAVDEDGLQWVDAHGARRYSYLDATPRGAEAAWRGEAYQLGAGTYLGERLHVRAYTHPDEDWTAIQAHTDYWDWFRLRHTVPDVREAGLEIEEGYIDAPFVAEVRREYHGIEGGHSDGWVSVIELSPDVESSGDIDEVSLDDADDTDGAETAGAGAADSEPEAPGAIAALLAVLGLLGLTGAPGAVAPETRRDLGRAARALAREASRRRRSILLGAVLGGVVLGVRIAGIAIETAVPGLHPKAIAAVLYPVLALGLPAGAARLARGTEPAWAVAGVAVGVGTAFVLDFGLVSVSFLPVRLVLHRFGLLLALGSIAAGSATDDERGRGVLVAGVAAWIVGLALPLSNLL